MKNFTLRKALYTMGGGSLVALALFLMLSSAKSDAERRCSGMIIHIKNNSDQLLVKPADVEKWATQRGAEPVDGKVINSIDLKAIERRVETSGLIKDCEAYIDLKGRLILDVEVYKPIARILGNRNLPDRYMDEEGHFFSVSRNFTPTVMLVSGDFFQSRKGLESANNSDLLEMINTLTQDTFWNAQITRIDVSKNKEIILVPLLGDNIIEFGKPEKVKSKLDKLLVFYKKILPQDQWSNFRSVSVKYDGQIVCN